MCYSNCLKTHWLSVQERIAGDASSLLSGGEEVGWVWGGHRNAPRMRKSPEGKWQGTSVPLDGATLAVMQEYERVRIEHH